MTSDAGISKLLRGMDKTFEMEEATLLNNTVLSIFDFVWTKEMTVDKLVLGFHSSLDKITKLNTNDELKGHLLLRQANLDGYNRNLIIGDARGDYTLLALSTSLRNAYRS